MAAQNDVAMITTLIHHSRIAWCGCVTSNVYLPEKGYPKDEGHGKKADGFYTCSK